MFGFITAIIFVPIAWTCISPFAAFIVLMLCGFCASAELMLNRAFYGLDESKDSGHYLYDEYGNEIGYIDD